MNKRINFTIATVLSMGLFVSGLTAAPRKVSPDFSTVTTLAQLEQTPAANTATSVSTSTEIPAPAPTPASPTSSQATQSPASVPAQPRPKAQASVSRGTVNRPSSAPSSSQSAAAVISTAKRYLGVKYVWGGTTPSGFDCSGYTQYVFAQHGISLPRISRDQLNAGRAVSLNSLQPGDLVFFSLDQDKVIDHVGIYIGDGQFINASTSKGVTIYPMGSYWQSHLVGATRVL